MGKRIRCPRLQAGVENQATNGEAARLKESD